VVAILLLAVVVASGLGYWLLAPKIPSRPSTYTTQQTSLTSSSQTIQSWTTSSTTTSSTTLAETVQWINITGNRPVSFYLKLLESNGTEPYVQLARELRKIPDATNATAVAEITYLALNATNPEVREAFQLILRGGSANPSAFGYPIPQYNTELEILYWLANGRQLKRDDTLALAISMSNGIWVTLGDQSVQLRVKKDVVDLLDFFRDTDELQQRLGYSRLEQLPLEAKAALAWLGADTGKGGPHAITGVQTKHDSTRQRLDLVGYEWDSVNITNMKLMRDYMTKKSWISPNIDQTVATVEDYFFFSGFAQHWNYVSSWDTMIQVGSETVAARNMNDANFNFRYYLEHGYAIGVCADEMTLVSAFLKSWGIATLPMGAYWFSGDWYDGHTYTAYYEPTSRTWKVVPYQIGILFSNELRDAYVTIPPILQNDWIPTSKMVPNEAIVRYPFQNGETNTKMVVPMYNVTSSYMNRFAKGFDSAEMKQVILYKIKPPTLKATYEKWSYGGPWNVIHDGSKGLIAQDGRTVGDFGQPYVILTNVSYSYSNGSLFFLFGLHGKIPSHTPANVSRIWYQVLLDVDTDSSTGYHWSSNFTPDYILEFTVDYASTDTPISSSDLAQHCGGVDDYCWTPVGFTQRFGATPLIGGGVGEDFLVLTCEFKDIQMRGFTIRFFARGGILYNGQPYADPVPGEGTMTWTIPAPATSPASNSTNPFLVRSQLQAVLRKQFVLGWTHRVLNLY
jgi:hypothetical protein